MNTRRLIVLALVLGLLLPTAAGAVPLKDANFAEKLASFDPLTGPCALGGAYDPACDVNHDGAVNVLDVQLAAGHWNQSGTWTSDNDHNHLGQTWTGVDNSLVISGTFDAAPYVPGQAKGASLVLANTLPTQP
ncbi:MAG: hypothetical protein KDI07_25700, partial [Anaerolineae bacterium]|nr:hypothetical protein [Anaerolineae bacterium]